MNKHKIIIIQKDVEGGIYTYTIKSKSDETVIKVRTDEEYDKYYACEFLVCDDNIINDNVGALRKAIQKMVRKGYKSAVIEVKGC